MPIKKRNMIIYMPGETPEPNHYRYRDDPNLFTPHKSLNVNDKVIIVDPSIIDPKTNEHARINCVVHYTEQDPRTGTYYYYFIAVDHDHLNVLWDNKFPEKYYKILESTSPYIIPV